MRTGRWWGNLNKKSPFVNVAVGGMTMSEDFFAKLGGMLCDLSQDKNKWRALVNMAMNLRVT